MNTDYLSIYLDLLWFLSSEFYHFLHIPVYILLELYLSMALVGATINDTVFNF